MALVGGALTGLHNWFGCEKHQSECRQLMGKFEGLKLKYDSLHIEPNKELKMLRLRELDLEFAKATSSKNARPWIK